MTMAFGGWLKSAKVLGINRRNAEFIMQYNPRSRFPLVDNKVLTKRLALEHDVLTPLLYYVIQHHGYLKNIEKTFGKFEEFVVKPARGSGGSGIILVAGHTKTGFVTKGGEELSKDELKYHISEILSGVFSLEGLEDWAVVESLIHPDPVFAAISYRGVPDIRVVVYRGVPVMSMVRLPTRDSDGKANLHQGAIGAGVDLRKGMTLTATHKGQNVEYHPDTGNPVSGIMIPYWERMLLMAARAHDMTGLGYIGVDMVLDENAGPMLLELNARPGLAIQMANSAGLLGRLEEVDRAPLEMFKDAESRVAWAKENLGSKSQ
jgi:alpha-L-glutamate ligase-like protein